MNFPENCLIVSFSSSLRIFLTSILISSVASLSFTSVLSNLCLCTFCSFSCCCCLALLHCGQKAHRVLFPFSYAAVLLCVAVCDLFQRTSHVLLRKREFFSVLVRCSVDVCHVHPTYDVIYLQCFSLQRYDFPVGMRGVLTSLTDTALRSICGFISGSIYFMKLSVPLF